MWKQEWEASGPTRVHRHVSINGPSSKRPASDGGRCSGQLLMMWSAVCSGSPHSHAALSASPHFFMDALYRPTPVRNLFRVVQCFRLRSSPLTNSAGSDTWRCTASHSCFHVAAIHASFDACKLIITITSIISTTNLAACVCQCVCGCAKFDQFLPARSHFDSKRPENFVRIATFPSATFGPLFAFHCPLFFTKNNNLEWKSSRFATRGLY